MTGTTRTEGYIAAYRNHDSAERLRSKHGLGRNVPVGCSEIGGGNGGTAALVPATRTIATHADPRTRTGSQRATSPSVRCRPNPADESSLGRGRPSIRQPRAAAPGYHGGCAPWRPVARYRSPCHAHRLCAASRPCRSRPGGPRGRTKSLLIGGWTAIVANRVTATGIPSRYSIFGALYSVLYRSY